MKAKTKEPLWGTAITTLCFIVVLFVVKACDKAEPVQYVVSFIGEGVDIESQFITNSSYVAEPENPERKGYSFGGWFTDKGTFANEWNFKTDIVTQDTTLYAKWEENSSQGANLQGTKWKLVGIGSLDKIALQELEPKDCDECYTFTLDIETTFITHSSANKLSGIYTVDYTENSIRLFDLFGTELGERGDGVLYVNILHKIHSFSLQKNELKLYFDENNYYLLFKPLAL